MFDLAIEPEAHEFEPAVLYGVRDLAPPTRLEEVAQVEPAFVVGAVTSAAERDDAKRVVAATERSVEEVGRVTRTLLTHHA